MVQEGTRHKVQGTRNGLNNNISMANRINNARASLFVLVVVGFVIVFTLVSLFATNNHSDIRGAWFLGGCTGSLADDVDTAVHTTVVYLYRGDDELYPDNLNFFLRFGVREGDGNRYYVVFPQEATSSRPWLNQKDREADTAVEDGSFRWCTCSLGCPKDKGMENNIPSSSETQKSRQWVSYYRGWSRSWVNDDGCACKCPKSMTTMSLPSNVIFVYHEVGSSSSSNGIGSSSSSSSNNSSSACAWDMISILGELMPGEGSSGGHHLPRSSKYYLLLDSTVRGPFLPLYLSNYAAAAATPTTASATPTTEKNERGKEGKGGGGSSSSSSSSSSLPSSRCHRPYRWTDAFTSRVTETVKLVGSAIACSPSPHVVSQLYPPLLLPPRYPGTITTITTTTCCPSPH